MYGTGFSTALANCVLAWCREQEVGLAFLSQLWGDGEDTQAYLGVPQEKGGLCN